MASQVYSGRYTVDSTEADNVVVFIIGMRINKWLSFNKWVPVLKAMPPMIRELYTHKELGCLSMENFFSLRTTLLIQYWRSEEDLLNYARGKLHLKAWSDFNKKVGNNDAVGIYHETYIVSKGQYETLYGNMPKFGLGKVFGNVPVTAHMNSARARLGRISK
ncbi:DUF4188 domain-containing protein [Neobacillus mesonae]|nr:DUF4188 domain-containing protein [Neobacillus mesonae]